MWTPRSSIVAAGTAMLLGLATLAVSVPATAATRPASSCTPVTPSRIGHFGGILAPRYPNAMNAGSCGATTPSSVHGTPPKSPYNGSPPLLFNGGAVMDTTSSVTVTPIYWAPAGFSFPASYKSLTTQFVADAAHDSGLNTNVFSALKQYTDGSSNHITYNLVAGTAVTDTTTYPTSGGCTADIGAVYSDSSGYSACLTDAQVRTEITNVLTAHSLASGLGHLYLLFLPKGVESCFTTVNNAGNGQCTISSQGGAYCGYHSDFGATTIYANLPYAVEDNPVTGSTCSSDGGRLVGNVDVGNQTPNGNLDADTVLSVTSHEMNEALSDPQLNAWFDGSGNENGDDCAYIYGDSSSFGGASGAHYNQTINGHHYFIQEEFSNALYAGNSNFACVQQALAQTVSFTSTAPSNVLISATYNPTATSTSGGAAKLSIDASSTSVCSINGTASGSTVTFNAQGTCKIDANQPGSSNYAPAAQQQQSVTVGTGVADGTGTVTPSPTSLLAGSSGDTIVFTYKAGAGGVASGEIDLAVPAGWSAPSTKANAAGDVTSTCGTVAVVGSSIHLTAVTLAGAATCTVTFGSKAGGGPGAKAPTTSVISTFAASEKSTAGGTLKALAASPKLFVNHESTSSVLKLSSASSKFGHEQTEKLSVTLKGQLAGTVPTGKVTIKAGTTTLCTITLVGAKGSCLLKAKSLAIGVHYLTATYAGSSEFNVSVSPKVKLTITK